MAKAPLREQVRFSGFETVSAGIVDWPMSVLRLRSADRESLIELSDRILAKWRGYSDESAEVLAFTGETPHNTITPHCPAQRGGVRAGPGAAQQPHHGGASSGIVPSHGEYHHIKKENIGLIEVMGLAILPPRLLQEAELMEQALSCPEGAEEIFKRPEMEKASGLVCRFESGRSYGGECRPGCEGERRKDC